jgi:hypothetical protein
MTLGGAPEAPPSATCATAAGALIDEIVSVQVDWECNACAIKTRMASPISCENRQAHEDHGAARARCSATSWKKSTA